jgi:hypothetical protein
MLIKVNFQYKTCAGLVESKAGRAILCEFKMRDHSRVLVAHACNPSYSGGRDQEDHSLKSAQAD